MSIKVHNQTQHRRTNNATTDSKGTGQKTGKEANRKRLKNF
jgi:hypothetical protein